MRSERRGAAICGWRRITSLRGDWPGAGTADDSAELAIQFPPPSAGSGATAHPGPARSPPGRDEWRFSSEPPNSGARYRVTAPTRPGSSCRPRVDARPRTPAPGDHVQVPLPLCVSRAAWRRSSRPLPPMHAGRGAQLDLDETVVPDDHHVDGAIPSRPRICNKVALVMDLPITSDPPEHICDLWRPSGEDGPAAQQPRRLRTAATRSSPWSAGTRTAL